MATDTVTQAVKVVVTGPFGVGKTTFIRSVSEIDVVSTERAVTDETAAVKPMTTVAMDFGRITVDRDLVIHLYGTPGQGRFDFMWSILSEGMLGFVLMVDRRRPETIDDARFILDRFSRLGSVPFMVAVNKVDDDAREAVAAARSALGIDDRAPVVAVDARDRGSVKEALVTLLTEVMQHVRSQGRPVPAARRGGDA